MKHLILFENFNHTDEECPICLKLVHDCECDYNSEDEVGTDEDDNHPLNSEDSNIDLSIELENKLRFLSDDSKLTINNFLEEFGVDPEIMTNFALASIFKNAKQYKELSDEEFNKLYDKYKSSLNESLIIEKNVPKNSEQKKASVARKRRIEKEGNKGSGRTPNYSK